MKNAYEIREDTTAIFLNKKDGRVLETIIDTCDLERVLEFPNTWCSLWSPDTRSYYCYGKINRQSVLLHRWVAQAPDDIPIDHIDNNTLNNRRLSNLRFAEHFQNHQNRLGAQRNSKSGVRGVSWYRRHNKWQAAIKVRNQRLFLGYFKSLSDAEMAVKKARQVFMPFSKEAAAR